MVPAINGINTKIVSSNHENNKHSFAFDIHKNAREIREICQIHKTFANLRPSHYILRNFPKLLYYNLNYNQILKSKD